MSKVRDRTEDFKDAVRRTALSLGFNESKTASLLSSFIMHKPRKRSPFMSAALKTLVESHCNVSRANSENSLSVITKLESIAALDQFLLKHKKDYVDVHRTTEQERDSIEHEVTTFIKACKEQIDVLKSGIMHEEANSRSWLGIRDDTTTADAIAHKHGVVLILSEKLHSVTSKFDQLRAIRFQDAINRVTPRRKPQKNGPKNSAAEVSKSDNYSSRDQNISDAREPTDIHPEPMRVQEQLLDDETRALQVELSGLLDAVQETESKMVEMSALNHLMSTHVLQQSQQIEFLYEQAIEATQNVELGNKELTQAIQRNSSSRTFLLLFLFVLTFSVLFLDWYS